MQISKLLSLTDQMQTTSLKLDPDNVQLMATQLLRPRAVGKRPDMLATGYLSNDLRVVSNIMLRAMETGVEIPISVWLELFRRHGMKDFGSLERFCHATINSMRLSSTFGEKARHYGSFSLLLPVLMPSGASEGPAGHQPQQLRHLFTFRRQQNIVSWGFIEGLKGLIKVRDRHLQHSARRSISWKGISRFRRWPSGLNPPEPSRALLCGLSLLQSLHAKGVPVQAGAIEAVLRQRLWTLFGPGRSFRRRNVTLAALNPYTLLELLRAIDGMWQGPPLFTNVRDMLKPASHEDLLQAPAAMDELTSLTDSTLGESTGSGATTVASNKALTPEQQNARVTRDVARTIRMNTKPTTDPIELQTRRYVQALMIMFHPSSTIGVGTAEEKKVNREALSERQWLQLLYAWARHMVRNG